MRIHNKRDVPRPGFFTWSLYPNGAVRFACSRHRDEYSRPFRAYRCPKCVADEQKWKEHFGDLAR